MSGLWIGCVTSAVATPRAALRFRFLQARLPALRADVLACTSRHVNVMFSASRHPPGAHSRGRSASGLKPPLVVFPPLHAGDAAETRRRHVQELHSRLLFNPSPIKTRASPRAVCPRSCGSGTERRKHAALVCSGGHASGGSGPCQQSVCQRGTSSRPELSQDVEVSLPSV